MLLAALLHPHWAEYTARESEAVTAISRSRGLFESCQYMPTGQIECYPLYNTHGRWVNALKAMSLISFGLMTLASFAILAGGNCTSLAFQELSDDQPTKRTALVAGAMMSLFAFVLTLTSIILMSIQISDGSVFMNSLLSTSVVSENTGAYISYGSSFILACLACGLSLCVGAMILGTVCFRGSKGAEPLTYDIDDYRAYEGKPAYNGREPLLMNTPPKDERVNDYI